MKNKVTSAAAILSLALAIGACTSAFRLIDALLLRPLPVADPERLYALARQGIGLRRQAQHVRRLGLSRVPADARRGEGSGRIDRHLLRRAHGSDLRVGSGDGEGLPAIRLRMDVRLVRTPARRSAACSPKTTISSPARIPTPCSLTTTGRAASDRIRKSIGRTFRMGDDLYEIVGVGRGALHRHRDRAPSPTSSFPP